MYDSKLLEANYLLGVSHLSLQDYEKAIKEFTYVIDKNPFFKKNIYILLAVGYKKLNFNVQAIKILNQCIMKFPKYYDAYIYRGKLFTKEKKYDRALCDYSHAITLNETVALGFLGKADCLKMMG